MPGLLLGAAGGGCWGRTAGVGGGLLVQLEGKEVARTGGFWACGAIGLALFLYVCCSCKQILLVGVFACWVGVGVL